MAKVFVTILFITSILVLIGMIESSKVGLGGHYEHHYTKNDFAGRRHRPRPWHSSSGSPSSGTSSSGSSSSAASSAGSSAGSSGSSAGSSAGSSGSGSSGGGSSGGGSGWGHRPHRPYRPWAHRHHSWNQGDGYVHRIYYGW